MSILTINSGSSSLKASLFLANGERRNFRYERIGNGLLHDHHEAFQCLLKDLKGDKPKAIGHRFVHGGDVIDEARKLDDREIARLRSISHLAPLHMPVNIMGAELCHQYFDAPQVACFDTAFHKTLPEMAWRLPIPRALNFRRYGFHGLNYSYIAQKLPALLGDLAYGRIVVAHLGNGASLCLMENLKSADTTMGYTAAGGIPMGTRSGDLDPGVMLELAKRYGENELADLIYHKMGLMALSNGESNEMSALLKSSTKDAEFAVLYFSRQVRSAIGAFAAKSGGIDALVFTAGIGENAAKVRGQVCELLGFLGFYLDSEANQSNAPKVSMPTTKPILIIPADEEAEIARMTRSLFS